MKYIMNERKYAEKILNGDSVIEERNKLYTVNVIAKYYRSNGYNDKEIKTEIEKLIRERLPGTPKKYARSWTKKILEMSKKYPLCEIDSIAVTKPEMELIKSLRSDKVKDSNLQKLAFTLLCFSKFETLRGIKDGWINTEWKHLFSAANIKGITVKRQCLFIYELYRLGYISLNPKIENHSIKFLSLRDGETEISVTNINECGKIFEEHCGKKFARCKVCDAMIPVTNGRNMYCRDCAVSIDREKARERMRKTVGV